ncbi:hypothetical protein ACH5RR_041109 [Cinchona calisaya]|uniref:Uncharacterized protein n=1 Tax=Cinchona calisaya TaxID=153742 RepID=A0ABD2XXV1_9GENT
MFGFDLCFRIDEAALPTPKSTQSEWTLYENWGHSNCLSLMIIKTKIAKHIRKSILESERTREFLALVEQQFEAADKALAVKLGPSLERFPSAQGPNEEGVSGLSLGQ